MKEISNPFSPGAGTPPPELAGRQDILEKASVLLQRVQKGRTAKSLLLTGLRGVGKTVLLNEINQIARGLGYHRIFVEAHEGKSLVALLAPQLRTLLYDLDRIEGAKDKVRRGLAVLRGFVGSVKLTYDDIPIGIDIDPEKGTADSGDLETDLPALFVVLGEAAASRGASLILLIDELQYFSEKELSSLIMAMHKVQQEGLPIVLTAAGLPVLPRLAGESKSYAERLFDFPDIGPLSESAATSAISGPIESEGEQITPNAVSEIVRMTQGYAYFLQEWGYQVWNLADVSPIPKDIVDMASKSTVARLDQNFFRVRFDRLTNGERELLRAMAELGPGPHKAGDVAEIMGLKVGSLSPRRAKLIHKGMLYSPQHGDIAFTVPLFDEFMRRAMPEWKNEG
jgi:hypothetical protein